VVELLFPDRTRGGVSVRDGHISVDLTYGIEQRRARWQIGDSRMGALSQVDLDALKRAKPRRERMRSAPAPSPRIEDLQNEADAVPAFDRGRDAMAAGRMEQAESAFREADRLGNPAGSVNLGNLLRMRETSQAPRPHSDARPAAGTRTAHSTSAPCTWIEAGCGRPRSSSCGLSGQAIRAHKSSCKSWRSPADARVEVAMTTSGPPPVVVGEHPFIGTWRR
jgi:hypothetical protein